MNDKTSNSSDPPEELEQDGPEQSLSEQEGPGEDGPEPGEDGDEPGEDGDEPWAEDVDPLATAEDVLDQELLALVDDRPPARWHRPVVMLAVCGLIIAMMVWFWHDLMYFFGPTEAIELGDAHDISFSEDWENRYVHLEGIPLAPRNENPAPQCGANQGFPTYQRRVLCRGHLSAIPVMGRPEHDLIIQRFMTQQLSIHYDVPEGQDDRLRDQVTAAARRVGAVHGVRPAQQGELGRLIADVEGSAGRTDVSAVAKSVRFQIEASVAGIKRVSVERVRREVPGSYEGRLVRLGALGSRFAAVADYLNECTNYNVDEDTWVVLDGSEAGLGAADGLGVCYGQTPRQYWVYLALYILLGLIFALNVYLLIRFFRTQLQQRR